MKTVTLFLGAGLIFYACTSTENLNSKTIENQQSKAEQSAIEPIEGLEIPIRTFTVSAQQPTTIDLPNGGSISVPADAFVDEHGKPIQGDVQLEWQEFHSLTDIALSGIPMAYDSAGVQSELISGGMFTIDGKHNGSDISIAPNKRIEVNLASNNPQQTFNFYQLDEASGKWTYQTTKKATPVPGAPSSKNEEEIPLMFDVQAHIDQTLFPELSPKAILGWEVDAKALSTKELDQLRQGFYTVDVIEKGKKGKYKLALENKREKHEIEARPVTFDQPVKHSKRAAAALAKRESEVQEYQNLMAKGDLIRSIEIPSFGTYNWDCMYKEETVSGNVVCDIPGSDQEEFATFFFVSPSAKRIIPIERTALVKLAKAVPACIIAITMKKEVFTIRDKSLSAIRTNNAQGDFTFLMEKVSGPIHSGSDLATLMDKCI